MSPEYYVEALARGLRVLSLFDDGRPNLAMKEIAEETGIPLPSIFRTVSTLAAEGYLEQRQDGRYQPGIAVLKLGFAALGVDDGLDAADPILRRLAADVDATVNLGALQEGQVLYLARIRDDSSLVTANLRVGSTLPASRTSIGKVLLATLPADALAALTPSLDLKGVGGPNAIRSLAALKRELKQIKERGYAVQDEEVAAGLRSVAAPVVPRDGRVRYAVNIAVPSTRSSAEDLVEDTLEPLLATCQELALRLATPG